MLHPLPANLSPEQTAIVMETLPETALVLTKLIGLAATLTLVEQFGGTELKIPLGENRKAGTLFRAIAKTMGKEVTQAVAKHFGGDVLYIPNCSRARRVLRDMEIVRNYDELTRETSSLAAVSALAKQYFLSYRCIEIIVNRPLADGYAKTARTKRC